MINKLMIHRYGCFELTPDAPLWAKDLVCDLHKNPTITTEFDARYDRALRWVMSILRSTEVHIDADGFSIDVSDRNSIDTLVNKVINDLAPQNEQELYEWAGEYCTYELFINAKNKIDSNLDDVYDDAVQFLMSVQFLIIEDIVLKFYNGHLEESKIIPLPLSQNRYAVEIAEVQKKNLFVMAYSAKEAEREARRIAIEAQSSLNNYFIKSCSVQLANDEDK